MRCLHYSSSVQKYVPCKWALGIELNRGKYNILHLMANQKLMIVSATPGYACCAVNIYLALAMIPECFLL